MMDLSRLKQQIKRGNSFELKIEFSGVSLMDEKRLYFIGLLLPEALAEKIAALKNNFAGEYHCSHALKVLPHITIQKPFKTFPSEEVELHLSLQHFFEAFKPVEIKLTGFGSFDKKNNKVIFIDVKENPYLLEMHQRLMEHLRKELKFPDGETPLSFYPHITIAYRDLSAGEFEKAWPLYKERPFEETFMANCAYLLKHNFRKWEVLSEFAFNKK